MNTLTKEWLLKTIAELEEERDATPGAVNEDAAMALEAMKRALASLMADPVAWTDEQELRDVEKYGCGYLFTANPITPNADPHRVIKLYTVPPAPVSVKIPPEKPHNDGLLADGWNACRTAMLQGAEHVSQRYTLPDGFDFDRFNDVVWLEAVASNPHMHSPTTSTIAMVALELNRKLAAGNSPVIPDGWILVPADPTAEMLQSGISAHYERSQIKIHDRPAPGPMTCAYVAMLAAAPQQEVKNG
ncbi:hypothetical protein [Enterobacter hormaechei]|uniref:hypothetical protein n=1 Tax=Enterobacter hormaechei TaxID=158836 RepID=UPI002578CE75|nr:hypothetical protein [Enterobacter hormaechei]MDM1703271.1 hypothetical protein [Enterobacter hormaechei]